MRHLPLRNIATSVVCAAFLLGAAAPVVAADGKASSGTAQVAPIPDARILPARTGSPVDPWSDAMAAAQAAFGMIVGQESADGSASSQSPIVHDAHTLPAPLRS